MTTTKRIKLQTIDCCRCGITFAVPADYLQSLWESHRDFYCPNGHPLVFNGETREEKLERRLRAAQDQNETLREQRDHERASKRATRGHLTRLRRRIAHGTCPCCKRTFAQLSRHMESQHPDYVAEHGTHDAEAEA